MKKIICVAFLGSLMLSGCEYFQNSKTVEKEDYIHMETKSFTTDKEPVTIKLYAQSQNGLSIDTNCINTMTNSIIPHFTTDQIKNDLVTVWDTLEKSYTYNCNINTYSVVKIEV